jgi:hypothetical protein
MTNLDLHWKSTLRFGTAENGKPVAASREQEQV